jgi:hypothetical protein
VRTAVAQLVHKSGEELSLQLLQLADTLWLGLSLGYGLDYLISSFLVRYPWGKVRYPLFVYLA